MDAEPLYCPECGYDLRGQRLQRCPECGFHYDRPSLEYLSERALQSSLAPLLDAISAALVGTTLSILGSFYFVPPLFFRRRRGFEIALCGLFATWLWLFARGLLLDWMRAAFPGVIEAAKDSISELFHRLWLVPLFMMASFVAWLGVSEGFLSLVLAAIAFIAFYWTVLGLGRIKDLPRHEESPALAPERMAVLIRARRAAIILLVVEVVSWAVVCALV